MISNAGLANSSAKLIPANSVILSTRAPIGHLSINEVPMAFNQGCRGLTPGDRLDTKFLYYFLLFSRDALDGLGSGTTFKELSSSNLANFHIPLPPLDEQRRIVEVLDKAFAAIAAATANTQRNLANAREIFEGYLESVFSGRDEEWLERPIGKVARIYDGPHATPKTIDAGPVFLGITAIQDGEIVLEKTRHVTEADFGKWTKRVVPQVDDIVFSYETRLGQAAIIPDDLKCCLGRRMGLVRLDRSQIDPTFFLYNYLSRPFQEFLIERTIKGATVDRIALKDFPSFRIKFPVLQKQKEVSRKVMSLKSKTQNLERAQAAKLAALAELKQSLLHQAFAGELI